MSAPLSLLSAAQRAVLGQFLTPAPLAALMASMMQDLPALTDIRALDAGAGAGGLCAALCAALCARQPPPRSLSLCAYEIDATLHPGLGDTLHTCAQRLNRDGIRCTYELHAGDFIQAAIGQLQHLAPERRFNCALVNPPYRKIRSDSQERRGLRQVGIETSNLYTAFVALIIRLLEPGGQLCAITPRSFCNGPYFLPFRRLLLDSMTLTRIHVFDARDRLFRDDRVLQENIIFVAVKRSQSKGAITLTSSTAPDEPMSPARPIAYEQVVRPEDPQRFIVLPEARCGDAPVLPATLSDLGVAVSTGRVVAFRARQALRAEPSTQTVPLLHPAHLLGGRILWPAPALRKPQHLCAPQAQALLLPAGRYVLVKRFTSKEQPRRVVAAVCETEALGAPLHIGVENHLNVVYGSAAPLGRDLARGLCAFLNSTLLDRLFRQFSGHTQVNATDLRSLRYPERARLEALGAALPKDPLSQAELDELFEEPASGRGGSSTREEQPGSSRR